MFNIYIYIYISRRSPFTSSKPFGPLLSQPTSYEVKSLVLPLRGLLWIPLYEPSVTLLSFSPQLTSHNSTLKKPFSIAFLKSQSFGYLSYKWLSWYGVKPLRFLKIQPNTAIHTAPLCPCTTNYAFLPFFTAPFLLSFHPLGTSVLCLWNLWN